MNFFIYHPLIREKYTRKITPKMKNPWNFSLGLKFSPKIYHGGGPPDMKKYILKILIL